MTYNSKNYRLGFNRAALISTLKAVIAANKTRDEKRLLKNRIANLETEVLLLENRAVAQHYLGVDVDYLVNTRRLKELRVDSNGVMLLIDDRLNK